MPSHGGKADDNDWSVYVVDRFTFSGTPNQVINVRRVEPPVPLLASNINSGPGTMRPVK
jgi:hypothetical protein